MKAMRMVLPLVAALVLPATGAAQKAFEGSVTYKVDAAGQAMKMTHHIKGEDVRMDMDAMGQSISVLTDINGKRQLMVMHGMRQYMDAAAMQQRMGGMAAAAEAAGGDASVADLDIKATGRKDTIAGHECEYFTFTSDGTDVEICAASGMGWYFAGSGPSMGRNGGQGVPGMSNAQRDQWQKMFADGFFPLKMTVRGSTPVSMEVTEISRAAPDASMFQIPTGYTEMRIGG